MKGTLTRARTELNPEYLDLRPRAELNPEYWTPCTPLVSIDGPIFEVNSHQTFTLYQLFNFITSNYLVHHFKISIPFKALYVSPPTIICPSLF